MKPNLDSTAKTFNQIATVVFIDAGAENYQQLVDGVIPTAASYLRLAKLLEVAESLN